MWCGVVWCGLVWCGVVWFSVVWCGDVWYMPHRFKYFSRVVPPDTLQSKALVDVVKRWGGGLGGGGIGGVEKRGRMLEEGVNVVGQ